MRTGEHSTNITLATFLCHITTCNDGCNVNEEIKENLIFIHSITRISTAPITEYFNKPAPITEYFNKQDLYLVYTVLICNKTCSLLYQLRKKGDDTIKVRHHFNFSYF